HRPLCANGTPHIVDLTALPVVLLGTWVCAWSAAGCNSGRLERILGNIPLIEQGVRPVDVAIDRTGVAASLELFGPSETVAVVGVHIRGRMVPLVGAGVHDISGEHAARVGSRDHRLGTQTRRSEGWE